MKPKDNIAAALDSFASIDAERENLRRELATARERVAVLEELTANLRADYEASEAIRVGLARSLEKTAAERDAWRRLAQRECDVANDRIRLDEQNEPQNAGRAPASLAEPKRKDSPT